MGKPEEACIICGADTLSQREQLVVKGKRICGDCERLIVACKVHDDDYEYLKEKVKKLMC